MARIRTIKPQLGRHRDLFELEARTKLPIRFVWAMFPTVCDREGRFIWRPWEIKLDILPYDEIDFSEVMNALWENGYIVRYQVGGEEFGCIPTFKVHQRVGSRETPSTRPDISEGTVITVLEHDNARAENMLEGKGREKEKEGKGTELRTRQGSADKELDANRSAWTSYRDAYFSRYGVEPARNAKVNSAIKQIVSRLGPADAPEVLRFFVSHQDSFYVRQTHSVSLALRDAETLLTQWRKGNAITQADVRRFEKSQQTLSLIDQIEREGV